MIVAVSSISAMKVETPFSWLSPAPTLQRIESKIGIVASEQGTKQPICAMRAMTPAWRMNVDFPPMFGPARFRIQMALILWMMTSSLMIWNSLWSDKESIHLSPLKTKKDTFYHFYIIRNKADVILDLQTRVSCIFENKITQTYLSNSEKWSSYAAAEAPRSTTFGLIYGSGAFTETCAKLCGAVSVDDDDCWQMSACLIMTSRCARMWSSDSSTEV